MNTTFLKTAAAVAAITLSGMLFTTTAEAKVVVVQTGAPALAAGSSYAWAPTSSAVVDRADPALANEITGTRLRVAIDAALAGRGYRRSGLPATADLAVSFHVVLKQQQGAAVTDNAAVFCGWRGCIRRWSTAAAVTPYNYTQGTLVLDLVDRSSGQLVWRAASEKRVTASDVSQARLNALVAEMMRSLPAG